MKNKNLLIGGAVVVGGLLFFYLRKKRAESLETPVDTGVTSTEKGMGLGTSGSGSGSGSVAGTSVSPTPPTGTTPPPTGTTPPPTGTSTQKLTPFEVNVRLLNRCGAKPASFRRQAVNNYDACKDTFKAELRSQGLISFNGLSEENVSRLDFDGNIID